MKQRFFALASSFTIRDEEGRDVFTVEGKLGLGVRLVFRDMKGAEVAQITHSRGTVKSTPRAEVHREGKLAAVVVGVPWEHVRLHKTFTISAPHAHDLTATGDIWDQEYEVRRGDHVVTHVSKVGFTWTDEYDVHVIPGEDPVLMLAIAVVIDLVCHPGPI